MAETIGIEGRGNFYEGVGALRDVLQNHVFQILSLLTMEPPTKITSEDIRNEKVKLFHTMQPLQPATTVRGQYASGRIDGNLVPGYLQEEGVDANSNTETFVATKVMIDNWRWAGVPFYLRTGKRLERRTTEIAITFKDVPLNLFEDAASDGIEPNRLFIHVQPDEGIVFRFQAKQPGPDMRVQEVSMDFSYRDSFGTDPAEAYEWLLLDAMEGDRTLFMRADGVQESWRIVQPVLDDPGPIHMYPAGTWGPPEADGLTKPYVWLIDEP
jgi:glucose-6-phosphate 1-dehydrogenase